MEVDTTPILNMQRGPYYNRIFRKTILPRLANPTGILQYDCMVRILRQQGFVFDPEAANKSSYDPQRMVACLAKYSSSKEWKPDHDCLARAVKCAFQTFGCNGPKLRPLSVNELKPFIKMAHSSGAPFFVSKMEAWEKDLKYVEDVRKGGNPGPCVAWWRLQHGDKGPKHRLVWAYPLRMTILEGRYARPLIVHFLAHRTPMAFGLTKLGLSARMRTIRNFPYQYGLDFSAFDASISKELIYAAFSIIRSWFSEECFDDICVIENYFINTPIVMFDGNIYVKNRGVPSGSYFTQIVDSIVNFIALNYLHLRLYGRPLDVRNLLVLGDDSVFGLSHPMNLHRASQVLNEIGLMMNPSKVSSNLDGEGIHFLGHTWVDGLAHRDRSAIAMRMIFPERWTQAQAKERNYPIKRAYAFLMDSVEAGKLIRSFPYNRGIATLHQVALRASCVPEVTDWQLLMHTLGYPNVFKGLGAFYLGVFC